MLGGGQEAFSIDRNTAVPLYHQIYVQLRDEIVSGVRAFGSLVPTEQELSSNFGVSRITARRALDELAEQNFVARKRRVGTQVIYNLPVRPIEANIAKAVHSLVMFGRNTKVTVLEIRKEPAAQPIVSLMGVAPDLPLLKITRLRWIDREPLGCTIAHLPEELGQDITEADLKRAPLLTLMQRNGQRRIASAKQTIAAVSADAWMASALKIEPIMPLLKVTRVYHDADGAPLLLTRAFYRADRYQVSVDLLASTLAPEVGP